MNHKQKLGYMALGAGILAVGIIIGQIITPDIEAQRNGVFDEIVCRSLKVVDKDGNRAISLSASTYGNPSYGSLKMRQNVIEVYDGQGKEEAVSIGWYDDRPRAQSSVIVHQNTGTYGVKMQATGSYNGDNTWNGIIVYDQSMRSAVTVAAIGDNEEHGRGIGVYGSTGMLQKWQTPNWFPTLIKK